MAVATKKRLRLKSATKNWRKLSKAERRVALANDVLQLLAARKATAESGMYIRNYGLDCSPDDDAKEALESSKQTCRVCAKGGLLLARVMGRNAVTIGDIGGSPSYSGGSNLDASNNDCVRHLKDSFSTSMLDVIEAAFEGQFMVWGEFGAHDKWCRKYPSDKKRLAAIMTRVVANKGEFTRDDLENP